MWGKNVVTVTTLRTPSWTHPGQKCAVQETKKKKIMAKKEHIVEKSLAISRSTEVRFLEKWSKRPIIKEILGRKKIAKKRGFGGDTHSEGKTMMAGVFAKTTS